MSLAAADENAVNPNEGATKVKDRNVGSVLSRRRKYLQEQKNTSDDVEDDNSNAPPITLAKDNSLLKKGWQEDEESSSSAKEQKGGRKLLGIFGKNSTTNVEKQTQQDNSYLFQNVPRPLEEEDEGAFIPSLDQVGGGMDGSVAEAPEEYAAQKVQTLQELDQSTKATLHHFLNMKYDDRGLDLSLLTGVLSYPLDELEQDDDWGNPQFVRDLLNSIKTTKKPITIATPTTPLAKLDRQVKTREL